VLRFLLMLGFTLSLGNFLGCGENRQAVKQEANHLRPLAVLYGKYLAYNRGKTPADENAFRTFIKTLPPAELQSANATDVEAIFVSTRDKKPYVLVFNSNGLDAVVAYEQEGLAGKRYIATSLGDVREVTVAELQQMVPGAK
jgi:hypothetical protein